MKKNLSPEKICNYILYFLLFIILITARDYGDTWDEIFHQNYGTMVTRFYSSFFKDTSAVDYMPLYGGFFDVICIHLQGLFNSPNSYVIRHMVNGFFGWLNILFAYKFLKLAVGWRTGIIAVFIFVCSPYFWGHMFTNPKDMPFASFYMIALYYLLKITLNHKNMPYNSVVKLCICIALGLNIRVGSLLMLCYFELLLGLLFLKEIIEKPIFDKQTHVLHLLKKYAPIGIIAPIVIIPLGTLCWPWALFNPYVRVFEGLNKISHFPWDGLSIFEGRWTLPSTFPWYYAPKFYLICSPILTIVGFCLSFFVFFSTPKLRNIFLGLMFATIFPLVYVIESGGRMYNGIRHILFIYPPMVALAALGFGYFLDILQKLKPSWLHRIVYLLIGILAWDPLSFSIRNHPFESIYYNQLVGGVRGAYMNYELDYWGLCIKPSIEWIEEQAKKLPYIVVIGADSPEVSFDGDPRFKYDDIVVNPNRGGKDLNNYHYYIQMLHMLKGSDLAMQKQLFAEHNIVYKVEVDEVPLCVVWTGTRSKEPNKKLK